MHNHSNGNKLRILMQIKLISLTIVEHQDSLRNRDKQQLGNGPLGCSAENAIIYTVFKNGGHAERPRFYCMKARFGKPYIWKILVAAVSRGAYHLQKPSG